MTLGKYQLMEQCQAAGVPAMPVQSTEDRVEHDPQLRHRRLHIELEHPALGSYKMQNAPLPALCQSGGKPSLRPDDWTA